MSGKQSESVAAKVIMAVFLFAMGCAAVGVGLRHVQSTSLAWSARSWVEVDAVLIDWDLGKTKKGYSSSEVVAEYQWAHGGKTYGSTRVALVGLRDSFSGEIKREAKSKFIEASRKDGAMKVWMNPSDPSEAVAVRTFPISWAAFASFFLMIPCGLATAFALGAASQAIDKALNKNWLSNRWGGLWLMLHGSFALPALFLADLDAWYSWSGLVLMGVGLAFPVGAVRLAWSMAGRSEESKVSTP